MQDLIPTQFLLFVVGTVVSKVNDDEYAVTNSKRDVRCSFQMLPCCFQGQTWKKEVILEVHEDVSQEKCPGQHHRNPTYPIQFEVPWFLWGCDFELDTNLEVQSLGHDPDIRFRPQ